MKKAIIIGASSGIGKELAVQLSNEGYTLGLSARRLNLLQDIQNEIENVSYIKVMDISQVKNQGKDLEYNLNDFIQEMDGVDLIIISAGTGHLNQNLDVQLELDTINVNVSGFTVLASAAFKYFQKKKGGHIVGISSIAALRGNAAAPSYNASKAYVSNYMEGLRVKAAKENINITISDIRPGYVDTDMAQGENMFWVSTPQKAAQQIIKAIHSERSCTYVTRRWRLIAWLVRMMPFVVYKNIA